MGADWEKNVCVPVLCVLSDSKVQSGRIPFTLAYAALFSSDKEVPMGWFRARRVYCKLLKSKCPCSIATMGSSCVGFSAPNRTDMPPAVALFNCCTSRDGAVKISANALCVIRHASACSE